MLDRCLPTLIPQLLEDSQALLVEGTRLLIFPLLLGYHSHPVQGVCLATLLPLSLENIQTPLIERMCLLVFSLLLGNSSHSVQRVYFSPLVIQIQMFFDIQA